MTAALEAYALFTAIAALLCFFVSCHKSLTSWYIVAGLVLPIPALIAVTVEPGRD